MSLVVSLVVSSPVCLGGNIPISVSLRNEGPVVVETASLSRNNTVLNLELYSENGDYLGTYNHVTQQLVHGISEPSTDKHHQITLKPGETESRSLDMGKWHWIQTPRLYFLKAMYLWNREVLRSDMQPLQVLPSDLVSGDYQWAYHYGEKYFLNSTWVVQIASGHYAAQLRTSARFSPTVVELNTTVHSQETVFDPRVSFDASLKSGEPIWLAWIDGGNVTCLRVAGGELELSLVDAATGLRELQWISAPLSCARDLTCFLSGLAEDGARMVVCLQLDGSGAIKQRQYLQHDFTAAEQLCGVTDLDGQYHLLWCEGLGVYHWLIDPQSLQTQGDAALAWLSDLPLAGIFVPAVLSEEMTFACMNFDTTSLTLGTSWLEISGDAETSLLKMESQTFECADSIRSCTGTMSDRRHPLVLIRSDKGLHYVNPMLGQYVTLAGVTNMDETSLDRLIVNSENAVYYVANRKGVGLEEKLLQLEHNEDLGELPSIRS